MQGISIVTIYFTDAKRESRMIRNIVFDMGKVLVGYDAMRVCEHFIEDAHDRKRVHTAVFVSPEWLMMDMGLLTDERALTSICARLPPKFLRVLSLIRLCPYGAAWAKQRPGNSSAVQKVKYLSHTASTNLPAAW